MFREKKLNTSCESVRQVGYNLGSHEDREALTRWIGRGLAEHWDKWMFGQTEYIEVILSLVLIVFVLDYF